MDETEKALVTTNDTVIKEGNTDMGKRKQNVVEEANTSPISVKKKIDTVKKTEKSKTLKNGPYLQIKNLPHIT